jgi:hypothetical protein
VHFDELMLPLVLLSTSDNLASLPVSFRLCCLFLCLQRIAAMINRTGVSVVVIRSQSRQKGASNPKHLHFNSLRDTGGVAKTIYKNVKGNANHAASA